MTSYYLCHIYWPGQVRSFPHLRGKDDTKLDMPIHRTFGATLMSAAMGSDTFWDMISKMNLGCCEKEKFRRQLV